jgi:hypothetical protein
MVSFLVQLIEQLRAAPSWPLVAMITTVARTTITAEDQESCRVFDPGTTIGELGDCDVETCMEDRHQ